jgi:hypothetical protein
MSTAPRGSILFRYTPGVGRVAALDCCGTGGSSTLTATCATAYSTSIQTLGAGTATNIAHDTVPFSYGIAVTTGANAAFVVPATGIYKIIPSVQFLSGGNTSLTIWIKVNGTNVPDSSTLTLAKNTEEGIVTCEYLLTLNSGDSVQVWARSGAHAVDINYIAAGGSGANAYPAAPGVITNMYRIR